MDRFQIRETVHILLLMSVNGHNEEYYNKDINHGRGFTEVNHPGP